jgi:hypothetical protein
MYVREFLEKNLNRNLLKDHEKIQARFDAAAGYLLGHCILSIDTQDYLVTEAEFYYHSHIHPDPYVHRHPNQSRMGLWYFHEVGQDLTFGEESSYGGILVRGIRSMHGDTYIDGPNKAFSGLFNSKLVLDEPHSFHIRLQDASMLPARHTIHSFPRVGMYPAGRTHDREYFFKPYRYLSFPWETRAERHVIYLYQKYIRKDESLTARIQVDRSMIRDYEKAFEAGKTMGNSEVDTLMAGRIRMNVLHKCRLLGWYGENIQNI